MRKDASPIEFKTAQNTLKTAPGSAGQVEDTEQQSKTKQEEKWKIQQELHAQLNRVLRYLTKAFATMKKSAPGLSAMSSRSGCRTLSPLGQS